MKVRIKKIPSYLKREIQYRLSTSHPRKILFNHLPKCGGATLNQYLEAHYPPTRIFSAYGSDPVGLVEIFKNLPEPKRHEYSLVRGHHAHELLDYVDPACLKVTVFREPVERIISHYFYVRRSPNHFLYSKLHRSEMSLGDYAASGLSGELRNWYTTHFTGLSADEAETKPEEAISKAAEVILERYDIIGFLDDFLSFIEELRERANLRYEYRDKRINVTLEKPSLDSIPQATIKVIEKVNHLDITLYQRLLSSSRSSL